METPPKRRAMALPPKSQTKATPTKPVTKQVGKNASKNDGVKASKSVSDDAVKNFPKNVEALVNRKIKLLRLEKEQKEMAAVIEQVEKKIEQKRANAVYLKDKEAAVKEAAREYGNIPLKVMRDSVDHAIRQLQFFQEQGYALPDGYDGDATPMEGGDNEESEDSTSIKREEDEEDEAGDMGEEDKHCSEGPQRDRSASESRSTCLSTHCSNCGYHLRWKPEN
ncbi:hypothetical protein SLS60_007332 [Paraconiothyrium brasiliense]|uniref:Uncharacterized protein n=1 Tax=Paraconiothyrium brasiliense TaxID=300254 RepID=A0ABR3R524_9PLEO